MDEDAPWEIFNSTWPWNDTTTESHVESTTMYTTSTQAPTTTPRPCFPSHIPRCDPFMKVMDGIQYYGTYSLILIGIPGNFLVLLVLFKMKPYNSSSVWLISLAFFDLTHVTLRGVYQLLLLDSVMGIWKLHNDQTCRFFGISFRVLEFTSCWLLVGLTVERFIAVWFPLKMNQICTMKKAGIGCAVIFTLNVAANLNMVETYRRHVTFSMCLTKGKYKAFWRDIYDDKILISLFLTVPVLCLIVFNGLIIARLNVTSSIQKQISEAQAKEKAKQQAQINRMLMSATSWAILTLFPFVIFHYYKANSWFMKPEYRFDAQAYRMKFGVTRLLDVLRFTNVVANLLLYVVAARKFRNELIRLVTCNRFGSLGKSTSSQSQTKVTTSG